MSVTFERACVLHDKAWAAYMKAWHKCRASSGRGSFKAQQRFVETSEKVADAQSRLSEAERRDAKR